MQNKNRSTKGKPGSGVKKTSSLITTNGTGWLFLVEGNGTDPNGNAIGKLRKTGKQQWTPEAQRYVRWKNHIQAAFLKTLKDDAVRSEAERNAVCWGKPIPNTFTKAVMNCSIQWNSCKHADPENVFGSIADALFVEDKHVDGAFVSRHGPREVVPSVLVSINFKLENEG